jgi:hypothetical protein
MTRLSGSSWDQTWTIADLPAVARLSLAWFVAMLFGVPTCLVTSTTDFPPIVPSAPYLNPNTARATPQNRAGLPITKLIFLSQQDQNLDDTKKRIVFSADVQCEDNGRSLIPRVFVNYNNRSQSGKTYFPQGGDVLAPSTFDDVRNISAELDWSNPSLDPGCYQVALVVSHAFDNKTAQPVSVDDTAVLVWWMLIDAPGGVKMNDCPGVPAATPSGDGGLDSGGGGV